MEPNRTRFVKGRQFLGELLLFDHKEHEHLKVYFLHRLRGGAVDVTAYPLIFCVSVDTEFD